MNMHNQGTANASRKYECNASHSLPFLKFARLVNPTTSSLTDFAVGFAIADRYRVYYDANEALLRGKGRKRGGPRIGFG